MKAKVFLCYEGIGWAINDDYNQTKAALKDIVEFTDIASADVVEFLWWENLVNFDKEKLRGKKVICHMCGEPKRCLSIPQFSKALDIVDLWVAQSTQAKEQLDSKNVKNYLVPYTVDINSYRVNSNYEDIQRKWEIPSDTYIISNFHRDTEGSDLKSPKLVKGPDTLLEIIRGLYKNNRIHVLLAGPRRFWVRKQLQELGVSYTFVGGVIDKDDLYINIQPKEIINLLYNISDLHLITSRSEGGPRTILEAAASKCKIISTRVGIAPDILQDNCIYNTVQEAIDIIKKDINSSILLDTIEHNYNKVLENNTIVNASKLFKHLYDNIGDYCK